jgi:sugar fermentation stimulation protein A
MLARPNRFVAEVELASGEVISAHVPNTGTMMSCWRPGVVVEVAWSDNPRRKLRWTLERTDMGGGWIGVNTMRPNQVMAEGILSGRIAQLSGYRELKREATYNSAEDRGRIDIALSDGTAVDALVEVKNVTLLDGDRLRFPDAKSERGRKHLALLSHARATGLRAVMLFALNRPEGNRFAPAAAIDPNYARALAAAADAGVEILAVRMEHRDASIVAGESVPVELR